MTHECVHNRPLHINRITHFKPLTLTIAVAHKMLNLKLGLGC